MVEIYVLFPLRKKEHKFLRQESNSRLPHKQVCKLPTRPLGRRGLSKCISFKADGPQYARLPIRPTAKLPSCRWSLRIFPSLPGSPPTFFYRDASSTLLQLVNQWLKFTSSRSHTSRYGSLKTNSGFLNKLSISSKEIRSTVLTL